MSVKDWICLPYLPAPGDRMNGSCLFTTLTYIVALDLFPSLSAEDILMLQAKNKMMSFPHFGVKKAASLILNCGNCTGSYSCLGQKCHSMSTANKC